MSDRALVRLFQTPHQGVRKLQKSIALPQGTGCKWLHHPCCVRKLTLMSIRETELLGWWQVLTHDEMGIRETRSCGRASRPQ